MPRCSRAFRFWTSRGAFSPFYTRRTNGCIDRPDTTARASFLRAFFFSPAACLPLRTHALETHFYSGQFRRLLLTFLSCTDAGSISHTRAHSPPPVIRYIFYFIRAFSTSHVYLISCTVNHCDVNYSDFSPQLPAEPLSILDRVGQLCR